MEPTDRKAFAEALIANAELYDASLSKAKVALYFDDLVEYPLDAVLQALQAHRKDPDRGRFFPRIADLIDKIQGTVGERALLQWSEVRGLLRDTSRARTDDPVTHAVVMRLGGWQRLGRMTQDQLRWVEREFVSLYTVHAGKPAMLSAPGVKQIGHHVT